MNATATFSFREVLAKSHEPTRLSVTAVLAWIAGSDGIVAQGERDFLDQLSGSRTLDVKTALQVGNSGDTESLQAALEFLVGLPRNEKVNLVTLAVGITLADGYVRASESCILIFLADLFQLGQMELNRIFTEATGEPFPKVGDPSSAQWWRNREAHHRNKQTDSNRSENPKSTREWALTILGLTNQATRKEIIARYRLLASKHHPDRFAALGEEAVETAEKRFREIKQAHDYLVEGR